MAGEIKGLDVTIMGREFRVACPAEEEQGLLEAVAYLDSKMREIRDSGKIVGIDRIAVMAALNITHEFLHMKVTPDVDLGDFKRRITRMQGLIDKTIAEQNSLF
ncbi:cell division protein ZapA [Leeia sp. TBRC 13508]|uniref:Cell division protein ZapA n=1 Tax=Leeia speluncae TaxID=2884804 RepID=A0ABS8D455_9NEIS|nr:cell division protein ZapA [Leeia speluncae]MCB6182756.1 cell division protein ZapA [Leeia speluncae]